MVASWAERWHYRYSACISHVSVKVDIALAAAVVMSVGSNFVKGPANAATMHCCLQRRLNLDRCKGLLENGRTMMMDEIRSMWLGKERRGAGQIWT